MKLYLPTTIATLMLLGVPSSSTAAAAEPVMKLRPRDPGLRGGQNRDIDSQEPRLYYDNTVQSNINSFAATSNEYDIRNAFCYIWDGQAAQPNPSWPVLYTRTPTEDCVDHCDDLRGCTGWEWRQNRNECHFFNIRNGGNFLPTSSSSSEICGWRL
eukprot:scaffold1887_cov133-Skeletonema_menzelii.AAC.2